jgi:hypothetical protein
MIRRIHENMQTPQRKTGLIPLQEKQKPFFVSNVV